MTIFEGQRSFFIGAQAALIEDDREVASSWAGKHIVHNPAYKYVLGRYVEADKANNNRQLFSMEGLKLGRPSITYAPMNMNHQARRVVGAYIATEMLYPAGAPEAAADSPVVTTCPECGEVFDKTLSEDCPHCAGEEAASIADASNVENPYIEALGVFWKHYFPEEYALVEAAHAEGRLYYSMECIPKEISCEGEGGCGATFEYAGRTSPTYCEHINEYASDKLLIKPHFTAGAILIPPVMPGWSQANVHSLVAKHAELAERIYDGVAMDLNHLEPKEWETLMGQLLTMATE